ncbi:hypothetical protein TELCIR_10654 [Teladorsagia circumcincta]|uniref:Protein kinase domain-containing protein n=1 Tax=Teladorsagia circumcincta TaxID=45464 RepID=A0A2G9UDN5_TELCI|nr:hypothetical protein TELCIR_10654 [Teladorsagia circumcincta]
MGEDDNPVAKFSHGKRFGEWVIVKKLDEGGFGHVYKVESTKRKGQAAALKAEPNDVEGGSAIKLEKHRPRESKANRATTEDGRAGRRRQAIGLTLNWSNTKIVRNEWTHASSFTLGGAVLLDTDRNVISTVVDLSPWTTAYAHGRQWKDQRLLGSSWTRRCESTYSTLRTAHTLLRVRDLDRVLGVYVGDVTPTTSSLANTSEDQLPVATCATETCAECSASVTRSLYL